MKSFLPKSVTFILMVCSLLSGCGSSDLELERDYDMDNDGLIEILSLVDLNEVRNDLTGTTLYGSNSGCPSEGCVGIELTQDLDFDSNGDGAFDSQDEFYHGGEGWLPIAHRWGIDDPGFSGIFEGNGFSIRNLTIRRPGEDLQGLFGLFSGQLRNLILSEATVEGKVAVGSAVGHLYGGWVSGVKSEAIVTAESNAGGLVGQAISSVIKESLSEGKVSVTQTDVGGLVGAALTSEIMASASSVDVEAGRQGAGGLLGRGDQNTDVVSSFATGNVTAFLLDALDDNYPGYAGGLVGHSANIEASYSTGIVQGGRLSGGLIGESRFSDGGQIPSYWAIDSSGIAISAAGLGVTLEQLQCPTSSTDTGCSEAALFIGWDAYLAEDGSPYWRFGGDNQLPTLYFLSMSD